MFELGSTSLLLAFLVLVIGLPLGVVLNAIISGKLARRFGAPGNYCYTIGPITGTIVTGYTIGFIAGAIATVGCMVFIGPIIGWFVSFPVSIALTWLMVRYMTMGRRS